MPDSDDPLGLRYVLKKRVTLAFNLLETEGPHWEELLGKSLNDQKFLSSVQSLVRQNMQIQLVPQLGLWGVSGPPAQMIAKGMYQALSSSAERQIKATASYGRLKDSMDTLKADLLATRPGLWVTENRNYLIVSGTMLGLAGLAASYHYQKGSQLFNKTINGKQFDIKEFKEAKFLHGGTLKLGVVPQFDPNGGQIGGGLTQNLKFKRLEADHRFDFNFQYGGPTKAESHLMLKLDLPKETTLKLDMKADYLNKSATTALDVSGKFARHASWNAGVSFDGLKLQQYSVGLGWDGPRMNASISATVQPKNSPSPVQVDLGLKIPF